MSLNVSKIQTNLNIVHTSTQATSSPQVKASPEIYQYTKYYHQDTVKDRSRMRLRDTDGHPNLQTSLLSGSSRESTENIMTHK